MSASTDGLLAAWSRAWKPARDLMVSEWADSHRVLSKKSSSESGRWRTERTPYLREIMDVMSDASPVRRCVFVKGSQIGGTEAANNFLGYTIHHSPASTLFVMPTLDMVKKAVRQRIDPMISETKELRELVRDNKSKDSANNTFLKDFPGGLLMLAGANSASSLRSMPIARLICDEIDGYPHDVDGEGDPVSLAEKRTQTFSRRKVLLISTPTIKGESRIEREYLASDQRRYFVPCPHCNNYDWIRWQNIKFNEGEPDSAMLLCESCGTLIEERFKTWMLDHGEWRATAKGNGTAGFHLSSLYSPLGWKSWSEVVAEFLDAKTNPTKLKTWVNTILGETWEVQAEQVEGSALLSRRENYDEMTIPDRVLVLTAGVDVQSDRWEVEILGSGRDQESWGVQVEIIYGDPGVPAEWSKLDEVLLRQFRTESGRRLRIAAAAIDSGGRYTQATYNFVRNKLARRVYAIKGRAGSLPIWPRRASNTKKGAPLFIVGVDTAKELIYSRLKIREHGAGYCHFPASYDAEYFDQLTAEKVVTKYDKGFPKRVWIKDPAARNEGLDMRVYAIAALESLNVNWSKLAAAAEAELEDLIDDSAAETIEPEDPPPTNARQLANRNRRRGGFVKSW